MGQRERFEAYMLRRGHSERQFTRYAAGAYHSMPMNRAWEIWQTAEAGICDMAAQLCDEYGSLTAAEKDSALLVGKVELSNAMSGEPRAAEFLAKAIRALKEN